MHNIWNVTSHNIGRTHTVHTKHCTKLPIENWSGSIHCLLHTFHCSVQSVRSDKGRSTLTYHWTRGSTLHCQFEIRPLYTLVSLCIHTHVYSCILVHTLEKTSSTPCKEGEDQPLTVSVYLCSAQEKCERLM